MTPASRSSERAPRRTPTGTGLNTFSTRIPVQAGDDISGIYTNAAVLTVNSCNFDNAYTDHYGDGDIAPGTTETFKEESFQHDVSAVLEPDCNHNGLGDETQEKNVSGLAVRPRAGVPPR